MNIDGDALAAMKRLHLPTIMEDYGIQLKRTGRDAFMARCPFHEDKTPSLSVSLKGDLWLWHCFGCREGGNVVDFKMKKDRATFQDTYRELSPRINGNHSEQISPPAGPPVPPAVFSVPPSEYLRRAVEVYHATFCENPRGQEYLARRGIKDGELVRRFKVGFVNGRLRNILPSSPDHEFVQALTAAGILNGTGKERFFNCVVFPIFDGNGAAVGLYGRNINTAAYVSHLYLPGPHRGVWNGAAFKAHGEVVLVESILDAMSLHQLGFSNAVAIYGTNGLTEDHVRLMKEHRTRRVFLCLDNDDPGRKARPLVRERIAALGVDVADVYLPRQYKDANVALRSGMTSAEFKGLLTAAGAGTSVPLSAVVSIPPGMPPPSGSAAPSRPAEPPPAAGPTPAAGSPAPANPAPVPASPAIEEKEDALFISLSGRVYRVKGLSPRRQEHMKLNIKLDSPDGSHLDTFDLYSSTARDKFVSCCRKIIKVESGELHRELNRLIEVLEGLQAKGLVGKEKEDAAAPAMTEEDAAAALAALKRPTLLADVLADMDTLGYVGEEHNKAIGILVGISRKLESPLACVIISQSSAGKSVLSDTVERMTPPEDVVMYSRVTQYAIYYATRDGLKHKLLILEERAGSEEADYPIRSLQSKKRLTLAVPVKDPATNQMRMEERVVEGPVAYMETTTKPRIHDENATRCFELFLDESEEQTRRIHERQRRTKTLAGFLTMGETDALVRRHHNMQRLLKAVAVVIPYADLIDFPVRWLRTRRDHMRFLNLIEVICFLYQHQRPVQKSIDGREYIEATVEDYAAAYSLAREVMGESFADLKKPQRELLKAIGVLPGASSEGVTRRAIRESTGLADTRLRELLSDLVSLEYVRELTGGGRGTTCRYTVLDHGPEGEKRLVGLTTPEELRRRLEAVRLPAVDGTNGLPSETVTDR